MVFMVVLTFYVIQIYFVPIASDSFKTIRHKFRNVFVYDNLICCNLKRLVAKIFKHLLNILNFLNILDFFCILDSFQCIVFCINILDIF